MTTEDDGYNYIRNSESVIAAVKVQAKVTGESEADCMQQAVDFSRQRDAAADAARAAANADKPPVLEDPTTDAVRDFRKLLH